MIKNKREEGLRALNELRSSILQAKVYYVARLLGWKFVERKDMEILYGAPLPVSMIDTPEGKVVLRCPLTGSIYRGVKAVIRYRRVPVTVSWIWWLAFRLTRLAGVNVHPDIPIHITPLGAKSILIGWLEASEDIEHERS